MKSWVGKISSVERVAKAVTDTGWILNQLLEIIKGIKVVDLFNGLFHEEQCKPKLVVSVKLKSFQRRGNGSQCASFGKLKPQRILQIF